jgi:hypothetical protein
MVDTQAITVRLPRNIYEYLRLDAFRAKRSMTEIITSSLSQRYDGIDPEKYGDLCALFEAAWHHVTPESLDGLPSVTSEEARKLATLAEQVMNQ